MNRVPGVFSPRHIESVSVATDGVGVHVTWTLGESVSAHPINYFTYSALVTGSRGSFVREFGVRFDGIEDPDVFPYVYDLTTETQANSSDERVTVKAHSVTAHFVGVSFGPDRVDAANAGCNVNGVDVQSRFPVIVIDR